MQTEFRRGHMQRVSFAAEMTVLAMSTSCFLSQECVQHTPALAGRARGFGCNWRCSAVGIILLPCFSVAVTARSIDLYKRRRSHSLSSVGGDPRSTPGVVLCSSPMILRVGIHKCHLAPRARALSERAPRAAMVTGRLRYRESGGTKSTALLHSHPPKSWLR